MYFTEAWIDNFGKFYQQKFSFFPGLNVVYGENESGKSTLWNFLLGTLFGMEKPRGRVSQEHPYQQYEPWNAPAYYGGALEFQVAGRPFRIDRNFYHKEKSALLRNMLDGEELSLEHGDLEMLLGGVTGEIYQSACCMKQGGGIPQENLTEQLQHQIGNLTQGGDAYVDIPGALQKLEQGRHQQEQRCRQLQKERQNQQEKLAWQCEQIQEDVRQVQRQLKLAQEELKSSGTTSVELDGVPAKSTGSGEENPGNRGASEIGIGRGRLGKRLLVGAVVLAVILCGWHFLWNLVWELPRAVGIMVDLLLLLGWIYWVVKSLRKNAALDGDQRDFRIQDVDGRKILQTQEGSDDQEESQAQAARKRTLEFLQEQLLEKETQLLNCQEELAELQEPGAQEQKLVQEERAYTLARNTIQTVATERVQRGRQELQDHVSRIFSGITGGAYQGVEFTERGKLLLLSGKGSLEPGQVSRGTQEQLYFALRVGAGICMLREEKLPMLLDEPFCFYDDVRLERTLHWLAEQPEQCILFTAQTRELELLEKLNLPYHQIILQ